MNSAGEVGLSEVRARGKDELICGHNGDRLEKI